MTLRPILRPGIDPGPLAWKASMQPLTLTEQVFPHIKNIFILIGNCFYILLLWTRSNIPDAGFEPARACAQWDLNPPP